MVDNDTKENDVESINADNVGDQTEGSKRGGESAEIDEHVCEVCEEDGRVEFEQPIEVFAGMIILVLSNMFDKSIFLYL